jgi:hypothetical protein
MEIVELEEALDGKMLADSLVMFKKLDDDIF